MSRTRRITPALVSLAVLATSITVAVTPAAHAAPNLTGVTMAADGFSVDLANSVQLWNGSDYITRIGTTGTDTATVRYGTFGNGVLNTNFGSKGTANAYFLARGGYVKKTGGTCATGGTYYQRSRITITGLSASAKDVWAFWDGSAAGSGAAQWEDAQFANPTATGTSSATTVTVSSAAGIVAGQYAYGTGIGTGAKVSGVAGTTVTLTVANSGAVNGTVYFGMRDATTANVDKLCDGSANFVEPVTGSGTSSEAVLPLGTGAGVVFNDAAGLKYDNTTATAVSFDLYVPTSGAASGWKSLSLGFVVDVNGDGTLASADDYGIQTQVYARPWTESGGGGSSDTILLAACSSPGPTDAPCLAGAATDNGVFAADGTTRIGTSSGVADGYSVQLLAQAMSFGPTSMTSLNVKVGLTSGASSSAGYEVPAGSMVKFIVSVPTSGTINGINYGAANFLQAGGNTTMKVDPADTDHAWQLATSSGRTTFTLRGVAESTSRAVSKQQWQDNCEVNVSGSSVLEEGCSADDDHLVIDTVPTTAGISWQSDPVMQTIGGGYVSTNAQGMSFGEETMAGTSFQFAVAGPSVNESGTARSSSGFYYVCVPEAFLAGSFGTTPAAAAATWQGTRDGAVISSGVSFAAGTCGVGPGLVASYPSFGYSAPLFSVKPPAAAPSSNTSSGSTTTTTTTTTSTSTTAPTTTTTSTPTTTSAAPVVYPSLAKGRSVSESYLLGLANWTPGKEANVSISVPRMYRGACAVRDGRVVATGAGTCGVRIKVVSPKGKVSYKRVYLTVGQ